MHLPCRQVWRQQHLPGWLRGPRSAALSMCTCCEMHRSLLVATAVVDLTVTCRNTHTHVVCTGLPQRVMVRGRGSHRAQHAREEYLWDGFDNGGTPCHQLEAVR